MAIAPDVKELAEYVLGVRGARMFSEAFDATLGQYANAVLPSARETVAVAFGLQKTAALGYDRVWTGYRNDMPPDMRFFGNTSLERRALALVLIEAIVFETEMPELFGEEMVAKLDDARERLYGPLAERDGAPRGILARTIADSIREQHGISASPVYAKVAQRDAEYREGDYGVVIAALTNLQIVDESALSWKQVAQFREDERAKAAFRRLTHWLDANFVGKTHAFIEDEIAIRLRDYEESLQRHGVRTILGSLAATLDSQMIIAGSAAVATAAYIKDSFAAALVGTSLLLGKVAVHVALSLVDLDEQRRGKDTEISFVAEVAKLSRD
ncbi:MAG TPA: hypothetical protein VHW00_20315 [Thermoanaerobaculia bacterium]|nr:hypothetical protein [Thermoanaerobaculia bacterium]